MSDRKEQIVHETFLLLSESEFSTISLSEIAARVGISKAAIYRHFPNKDALFSELQVSFFDKVAEQLRDVDFSLFAENCKPVKAKKDLFYRMFKFFAINPAYMFYLHMSFSSKLSFEQDFAKAMRQRGIPLTTEHFLRPLQPEYLNRYVHFLYIMATSIYFIHEKSISCPDLDAEVFALHMCDFLFKGWKGLESISEERCAVLNLEAVIHDDELPEVNKVFAALAKVIQDEGFSELTIEKLSAELGMAKSSLYSYFTNKHELITQFVLDEISFFVRLLQKRYALAQNTSEAVYIQLQMVLSYILKRQTIIPLFDWLHRHGTRLHGKIRGMFNENDFLYSMYEKKPALGLEISNFSLAGWISTLPVSIVLHSRFHHFTEQQLFDALSKVFDYMREGVK